MASNANHPWTLVFSFRLLSAQVNTVAFLSAAFILSKVHGVEPGYVVDTP